MRSTAIALILGLGSASVIAADWPNWRGPGHNGISTESGLAVWSSEPKVLWKAKVGAGYSGFAVAGGKAYTLGWEGDKDHVTAFNAQTGEKVWTHSYPCPKFDKYHPGGTGCTPTVHDGRVYTVSKQGEVFCLDATTGEVRWTQKAGSELGVKVPTWGFSGSLIIHGDAVIVDIGTVAAYDRKTGKELWRSGPAGAAYSTPLVFIFKEGGRELLASMNAEGLSLLDPANGQPIAAYPWKTQHDVNAATPVIAGDSGLIFISSGYGRGGALLRLSGAKLEKVWEHKEMKNMMNPSVLIGGQLYGFDGNNGQPTTQLACVDLDSGKVRWKQGGLGCGALTATADRKLVILSEKGELVIAEAQAEAYKELARAQVFGGTCWTVPVLADGLIYVRNHLGDVACVDVRGSN